MEFSGVFYQLFWLETTESTLCCLNRTGFMLLAPAHKMLGGWFFKFGWYPTKSNLCFIPHRVVKQGFTTHPTLPQHPRPHPHPPKQTQRLPYAVTASDRQACSPRSAWKCSFGFCAFSQRGHAGTSWSVINGSIYHPASQTTSLRSNIKWNPYFLDGWGEQNVIPFHVNSSGGSNDPGRKAEMTECLARGSNLLAKETGQAGGVRRECGVWWFCCRPLVLAF